MPQIILRVAVPSPLPGCLDYLPPPGCDGAALAPGVRIRVPLGRRRVVGVLVATATGSDLPPGRLRTAEAVLDRAPVLPIELMSLAEWASRYYHHPPGEVLQTMLPVALRQGGTVAESPQWRITPAGTLARGVLPARAARQRSLLDWLAAHPEGAGWDEMRAALGVPRRVLDRLAAEGWVESLRPAPRDCHARPTPASDAMPLSPAQREAVAAVDGPDPEYGAFLLEGITGSGKTEVYLELAQRTIARGRQVLMLVPEIGLTPQLVARVRQRLGVEPALLHSGMAEGQRLEAWHRAASGSARVVLGTRSAVFVPLPEPGLIVVDEEHDGSFKQQEGFRYHARDLAVVRARFHRIPVVLGSATPALESLANALGGRYRLLSLPERAGGASPPRFEVLDLRRQPLREGLSASLIARMRTHLERGEQVLVFLNRRGFAPTLVCHECGWLGHCQRCDARLTVHMARRRLVCHHCGAEQVLPASCSGCGSPDLRALGGGTERLERALEILFPEYPLARIDRDSTRRRGSLEMLLAAVLRGERRILLGTQMIAKGHHFPDVTLVAVVDADQALFAPDFRAEERLAQQLLQVAGRAGRADKAGTVLVQTHQPRHPLLLTLAGAGYRAFASAALDQRRAAGLPPYAHQALLRAEAARREAVQDFLAHAHQHGLTLAAGAAVEWLGPAPAPMERRAGRYRAHLLVQATERGLLHRLLSQWAPALGDLPGNRRVRWSLDIDPLELN